jgi:hypothetical protein
MIHVREHGITVGSWDDYKKTITATPPLHDVIINVCDKTPAFENIGPELYWYPLNERANWGYSVFFWAKRILDFHSGRGHSILIHCEAGVHRSPMILFTWLLSLQVNSGSPDLSAINTLMGDDYADTYLWDVGRGKIPAELERLYELMADPGVSLADCLGRMGRHQEH